MDGKTYTNGLNHENGVSYGINHENGVSNGISHENGVSNGINHENGVSNGISHESGVSQLKKKPEFKTAEECKSALEKAVIRRCMADVEIGLLLSGGLDSSILGALMIQPHIKKHLTGM